MLLSLNYYDIKAFGHAGNPVELSPLWKASSFAATQNCQNLIKGLVTVFVKSLQMARFEPDVNNGPVEQRRYSALLLL